MPFYISPPPQHPVTRIFAAIVAALALAGAFMLGIVALAVVIGLGLLVWAVVALRFWWLRRKLAGAGVRVPRETASGEAESRVIETEYRVVSRKQGPGKSGL